MKPAIEPRKILNKKRKVKFCSSSVCQLNRTSEWLPFSFSFARLFCSNQKSALFPVSVRAPIG
ncbi:hypothetical protein SCHPADRAFT_582754 [Schizopora paradoxa]|uniref:Uncharacterized protein n=1 Tax=Schizopora paradoxa TaxID=27342 RepID=A0A0H2RW88_9AGAM|nr:hypothetical protein SCHPADRAFT_581667 [Schizopora paradoxa]KLO09093.1 hypothetical protein SCHPADRAFT_582754 [Schizopora paradoxa]